MKMNWRATKGLSRVPLIRAAMLFTCGSTIIVCYQDQAFADRDADAAVVRKVQACWVKSGIITKRGYVPAFHFRTDQDGYFVQGPVLTNPIFGDNEAREAANSARRALIVCQPLVIPGHELALSGSSMDRTIRFDPIAMTDQSDAGSASVENSQSAAGSTSTKCNFYDWTPIASCVQQYHDDNDPLDDGTPNPRRWNPQLAGEGRTFISKHPDVPWNTETAGSSHTENAVEADGTEGEAPAGAAPTAPTAEVRHNDNIEASKTGEIATCNAPSTMDTLQKEAITPMSLLKLALVGGAVIERVHISEVVQEWYDVDNQHRSCSATLTLIARPAIKTTFRLRYHIDRRLDGDRGSLVVCDNCSQIQ